LKLTIDRRSFFDVQLQTYDATEFDKLAAKYEKLNWRMISKPGGATVKPDDFYTLYGCVC